MCFTAIHWARIDRIVYAATIDDARDFGFGELPVHDQTLKELGRLSIELTPGVLRDDALALFRLWRDRDGRPY